MKKFLLILLSFLFLSVSAETLRGGVTEEYIPDGFFGSWGVISKLISATKPEMFNFESKDIWTLSGYGNILILENLESGARSEIIIKEKNKDGKTLKFERTKTVKENKQAYTIYKETVEFVLLGNNFSGTDVYIVEKYKNNSKTDSETAKYKISGVKISGNNPK